jgi:hypothetical protein
MKKKIWVNIAESFEEAEELDKQYYLKMSGKEKLETIQLLREMYYKINKEAKNASRKGLRRIIRIIQ